MPVISDNVGFKNPAGLFEFGPTIQVHVGLDYQTFPQPNLETMTPLIYALIDTGATLTCIDKTLAVQLNLPIRGEPLPISGSAGKHTVNRHLGQIYIPSLKTTIYGLFPAVDLVGGGQPHNVLIGRAFLATCRMLYDGMTGDVNIEHHQP